MQPSLLPAAKIHCFWSQNYTADILAQLDKDWRFARVNVQHDKGDIVDAITRYKHEDSPDVLILEVDQPDGIFLKHLINLAQVCGEQTAALVIGPENDISLYRQLRTLGITDYLVRPVALADVIDAVTHILTERLGRGQSSMTAVLGSKGGVGTTRLAQALAQSFAQFLHEKCTLMDAGAAGNPILNAYGVKPVSSWQDAASLAKESSPDALQNLLHHTTSDLKLLAVGDENGVLSESLNAEQFDQITDKLMQREAQIVVDVAQPSLRAKAIIKANHLVIVSTAEPTALKQTKILMDEIRTIRGKDAPMFVVINKTKLMGAAESADREIEAVLGVKPFVILPFASDIFTAIEVAAPESMVKAIQPVAEFLAPLAAQMAGKPPIPMKTSLAFGGTGSLLKLLGGGPKRK
jgi:pilus assembly protein CpaE